MEIVKKTIKIDRELEDIVPDYLSRRRKDLITLQKAIGEDDFQTISLLGHRMAGNAGGYGFHELGVLGRSMEKEALLGHKDILIENIQQMENYLLSIEVVYE